MIQPGAEDRRRRPIQLTCAEDKDHIGRSTIVAARRPPDPYGDRGHEEERNEDDQSDQARDQHAHSRSTTGTPNGSRAGAARHGHLLSLPAESTAARPASSRATGMRNGEQDT
jgi:hypothetical protein